MTDPVPNMDDLIDDMDELAEQARHDKQSGEWTKVEPDDLLDIIALAYHQDAEIERCRAEIARLEARLSSALGSLNMLRLGIDEVMRPRTP